VIPVMVVTISGISTSSGMRMYALNVIFMEFVGILKTIKLSWVIYGFSDGSEEYLGINPVVSVSKTRIFEQFDLDILWILECFMFYDFQGF